MTYQSLSSRLKDAPWLHDWPRNGLDIEMGQGYAPLPSRFPETLQGDFRENQKIMLAFSKEDAEPVSLNAFHDFLDKLERFSALPEVQKEMTWPPTEEGFAKAITQAALNPENGSVCIAVMQAYPAYFSMVFSRARKKDKSIDFDFPIIAQTELKEPEAVVNAPPPPYSPSAEPASPRKEEGVQKGKPEVERPLFSAAEVKSAHDLVEKLLEILPLNAPIPAHVFDMAVTAAGTDKWSFASGPLLGEISKRSPEEFKLLIENWPETARIPVQNPVEWMDRALFWKIIKETPSENREMLMKEGVSKIIEGDHVAPTVRLQMLSKMLPFTAKREDLFKERVHLWMSLGGSLDQPCAVNENDSSLLQATTAREWISNNNNSLWEKAMPSFEKKREVNARFIRRPGGIG